MPLNEGWLFKKGQATVVDAATQWQPVTLPHTWNAEDGQQSGRNRLDANGQAQKTEDARIVNPATQYGYYRGPGWYCRTLDIPLEWKDKRVFVRFEAASQVARVHINGKMLGEHRGAFTAFCYELTPYLKFGGRNELRLEVDNTHRQDIPPLSGDFNVNGGLYRPAQIIVTDKVCISPLEYASPGVFITPKAVSTTEAQIEVATIVSNGHRTAMSNESLVPAADVLVKVDILDAEGRVVASGNDHISVEADTEKRSTQTLRIASPHLWQGRIDPYLYQTKVSLWRDGEKIDSVAQPLGVRAFAITQEQGFLLNGKPYSIYGVGRHQDLRDKAWALSEEDNERDYRIILDMGATAIRLAHYPQSQNMHDIADREGVLLWDEVPLVNEIRLDQEARQNVMNMMREMVLQLYNHPSVAWWGIYNEIENIYTPPSEAFLAELRDGIRALDTSSRFVVGASDHGQRAHNKVPEEIGFNNYPGWYHGNFPKEEGYEGRLEQLPGWIANRAAEMGRRVAITEYGAGGDAAQHTEGDPKKSNPAHGGPFQPEEWLAYVHEQDWRTMKGNKHLWGTFLWAMFDFASCMRNEGSVPSVNTKGIVSQDRQTKKDPYYFYKANWNTEPMVYIASRRNTHRTQQTTDIKVYSNCQEVVLLVNGKQVGRLLPDEVGVCLFKDIQLRRGNNVVRAVARPAKGRKLTDEVTLSLR